MRVLGDIHEETTPPGLAALISDNRQKRLFVPETAIRPSGFGFCLDQVFVRR